ncbi:MAG: OmpA family protein, partial [Spirochaetaceae bacterium]
IFHYQDGTRVISSGSRLTFFKPLNPRNNDTLRSAIRERQESGEQITLKESEPDDEQTPTSSPEMQEKTPEQSDAERLAQNSDKITVDETDIGVRLSLPALRFVADQAVVLPQEKNRIEQLHSVLQEALSINPDSTFLVVGHTADVGLQESQQILSEERAKAIVDMMVAKGIPADAFMFQGRGGQEPVASNSTDQGRALNRRVEVIIVE